MKIIQVSYMNIKSESLGDIINFEFLPDFNNIIICLNEILITTNLNLYKKKIIIIFPLDFTSSF